MKALAIAATGMNAQQTNLEVIANNIANINTTGFKRARAEFSDLLYQTERLQGVPNRANQNIVPEGANIGLGVKTAADPQPAHPGRADLDRQQARPRADRQRLVPDRGRRRRDALHPRRRLQHQRHRPARHRRRLSASCPAITVPADAIEVIVNKTGQVFARIDGQTDLQELGQLTLANFANEAGLEPLGDNLFQETAASGPANVGVPGDPGFATVEQGYLESSNVDPVKEITELISAQRAYEMNSKVIQAADEMAAVVSKNIR